MVWAIRGNDFELRKIDISFTELVIPRFLRSNLDENEINKYTLNYETGRNLEYIWEYAHYPIWPEGKLAFILKHERTPIAVLTFDRPSLDKIKIKQIQGIENKIQLLSPIRWQRALVYYTTDLWAPKNNIKEAEIVSAENNRYPVVNTTNHGKMLYNVTAKRSGFKKSIDGNYHRFINSN